MGDRQAEVGSIRSHSNPNHAAIDTESPNSLSLWTPIVLGLICSSSQLRIASRDQVTQGDEPWREVESLIRRRTSSSALPLRMLQGMRTVAAASESENGGNGSGRMILSAGPFGDYIMGPGWDLLLQYLSDNDPNRHGTLPAWKEAVEAMPTVTVNGNVQCAICLEDIEIGNEAKEMPCEHKFHDGCIIPWLELHNSCPVCQFQLPLDDSKTEPNGNRNSGRIGTGRRYWIPIPWPYDGLVTLPGSQSESTSPPSLEAIPGSENVAQGDEN
ncbi:E3 ubiquitin-protein ligase RING1-like [Gossypium australe]|uniref:RING-type E3 ubiquitin transferase n=1 Tax=Gossypium australe TaxID=47621 RepID=A0A5B6WZS7_9ROSI|nr:E3 ubiquitin-protein ligase RING1-like [Gossypium australe]